MTAQRPQSELDSECPSDVFDRALLSHYTMHDADLERLIIGLFVVQLTSTITMIETAKTAADWRLYTHTLRGSAAAVGARKLLKIAVELETLGFKGDRQIRGLRLQSLHAAAIEFRQAVKHIHP